ncbi:MAG TPA: C4-type zinc ribbon domain-containing protein [Streptosporangiaceae bacterium]
MKASPETQLRLLELADLDSELSRLEHRRRTLPEAAEVTQTEARDAELADAIVAAQTSERDLAREQAKAEADVEQVRTRAARDRERMEAGQVSSPRELEGLQSEIASLVRRQAELEDVELEVMERREAAQKSAESLTAERTELAATLDKVTGRRDELLAEIAGQSGKAAGQRTAVAADVPADLTELYERMRAQHGVGAAALRGGRCEGCHLALNTVDLNRIRAAAPDEVLRCEECRRILVRTPESGL